MLLAKADANAYAEATDPSICPIAMQSRYDRGLPTVTATTTRAIRSVLSKVVVIRNGRLSSMNKTNVMAQYRTEMHVTLNVPIRTFGGVVFVDTISEMKLAAIPIMAIRDAACRTRVTLKVVPKAPWAPIL